MVVVWFYFFPRVVLFSRLSFLGRRGVFADGGREVALPPAFASAASGRPLRHGSKSEDPRKGSTGNPRMKRKGGYSLMQEVSNSYAWFYLLGLVSCFFFQQKRWFRVGLVQRPVWFRVSGSTFLGFCMGCWAVLRCC